ncbi:hypothetical protein HK097_011128 [Rhizophlyctis rosea]|uniref:Plasmid stabilization protein n=1 Tax=Rhizophlyctis rosea TaxID=64517 RepID=A0AAD5X2N5_9FUNG|nr:hypothetical protein HK097_011128 [Rhizophlyctis rosea]
MAPGSKDKYNNKQKRMADHIKQTEHDRGANDKTASRIAWATVNKQTGGGRHKGGSGSGPAQDKNESPTASSSPLRRSTRKTSAGTANGGVTKKRRPSGSSIGVNKKRSAAMKKVWGKRRGSDSSAKSE